MKILFVTQNEAPFRMRWMDELAKYEEVIVFHINEYAKRVNPKYINYRTSCAITKDISKKIFWKKIFRISELKNTSYDLLILDGYGFFAQQILIVWLKWRKIPYVMSVDGGIINYGENKVKHIIKSFFMSGAVAYLSTAKPTDEFIKYYTQKNVVLYRHLFSSVMRKEIMDVSLQGKGEIRKRLHIEDKFTIIAVGQFIYRKGFDILLAALDYIKSDVQILFVGANSENVSKSNVSKSKIDQIHVVEFCAPDLLGEYYKASDIFVLPTRYDIWGLVIGEAMAYGLPVVTTDMCVAGVSMIQNGINGYIVGTENAEELADKIDLLQNDRELCESMGKNNIELMQKYVIEEAAKKDIVNFRKIYKELS